MAAGGCHKAAAAARMRRKDAPRKPQGNVRTQSTTPTQSFATRQSAALERAASPPPPPSGAAAFQGVIGESKEDLGGNRNPPNPPWPPEAATRLLTQQKAAQERRHESRKATAERRASHLISNSGEAPHKNATLRRHPKPHGNIKPKAQMSRTYTVISFSPRLAQA